MMIDKQLYGDDLFGGTLRPQPDGILKQRFTMPPFSVLDARSGDWQERKRAWLSLGIQSHLGRNDYGRTRSGKNSIYLIKDGAGQTATAGTVLDSENEGNFASIFDPVICELATAWFSPVSGLVLDPFAGGSVRGIVAAALGRKYWGVDISAQQVRANFNQALEIQTRHLPQWVQGDSTQGTHGAPLADFVFTCPPYGDLETYSNDPDDLSNMEWPTFMAAYQRSILHAVKGLRDDSFACFVVGDFRDKAGIYRDFVGLTVQAFARAGAGLYNRAVILTPVGTARLRMKTFEVMRKLVRTHQELLVFVKGDPRKAAARCNEAQAPKGTSQR